MDIFVPKFIRYQLYLLQLENYELGRYWKLLIKKGIFPRKKYPQRKDLVWTAKARALMVMAWALHGLIVVLAGLTVLTLKPGLDNFFTIVILVILILLPFYFVLFSIALLFLMPADGYVKYLLVKKAAAKIKGLKGIDGDKEGLVIIGIAGSYGKTTMKEVLRQVLGARFKVLATPESVNTPVGIARWILNKVPDGTQILIVEMGEHYENDIKDICDIAKPDIAAVTGINESHLERMKKMDTVVATIFEIVSNSKPGATVVLNADDQNVMENYKKFVWPDHRVEQFKIENLKLKNFDTERLGWNVFYPVIARSASDEAILDKERLPRPSAALGARNDNRDPEVFINLLGEYALGDVDAAIKIGRSMGMSNEQIIAGIKNIKPVEHRLQPIVNSATGVLVIDDSYNGNSDGVAEAIKVLSRFEGRRKLYITPGLVEIGKSSAEVHRGIGKQLAGIADVVILIKNSATPFIEEGILSLSSSGEPEARPGDPIKFKDQDSRFRGNDKIVGPQIIWFNSALEAYASLKDILRPGDVILFQNDWGDQYI
jgi:UDP-N-acetylmuramoyl-tripeptide--D-alanyl-D-alanine ligase